jgi:nucleoid-associated protein YgaU
MTGVRRTIRALAAGLMLAALLLGVPVLLAATVGNPLAGLPDLLAGDITDAVVIDVLAVVALLAWVQFAIAVAAEVVAAMRQAPMPRVPGVFAGQQQLAHALVAAALLTTPAMSAMTTTPPPSTAYSAPATPAAHTAATTPTSPGGGTVASQDPQAAIHLSRLRSVQLTGPDGTDRSTGPSVASATTQPAPGPAAVVIGDSGSGTLWDLAVAHLGNGQRWHEIWMLNQGRRQNDGSVMTEPGLLRPGWIVLLPTDAATTPETATARRATAGSAAAEDREAAGGQVVVERGDTLSDIASAHDIVGGWPQVWETNSGRLEPGGERFTDPDHIESGWVVDLPAPASETGAGIAPLPPPAMAPERSPTPEEIRTAERPVDVVQVVPTSSTHDLPRHLGTPSADADTPNALAAARHDPADRDSADDEADHGADHRADHGADQASDAVTLLGAGFGGGLLTGLSLAALAHRRRRQGRYRRPGRAIRATPGELLAMERMVRSAGSVGIVDVTWLDQALRSLPTSLSADPRARLPELIAVRMTHEILDLILAEEAPWAPAPWMVEDGGRRWRVRRGDDLGLEQDQRAFHFAPYPALVSVGYTAQGEQWLVDLERVGLCTLTGDRDRCLNLLRFVAAELAQNVWSEELDVDLVGIGREMAGLNPDRLHLGGDPAAAVDAYLARGAAVRDVVDRARVDVLTGRLRNIDTDMLMPRVLLLASDRPDAGTPLSVGQSAQPAPGGRATGTGLLALVERLASADTGRRGAGAAVVTGPAELGAAANSRGGWTMSVDAIGVLRIPALGLELIAQQVPKDEAAALAQLLAASAATDDQPMPPARGDQPWDAHADAAGALLPEVTLNRSRLPDLPDRPDRPGEQHAGSQPGLSTAPNLHLAPATRDPSGDRDRARDPDGTGGSAQHAAPPMTAGQGHDGDQDRLGAGVGASGPAVLPGPSVSSVLPGLASTYVRAGATTEEDVAALAPGVSDKVRRQVEQADPSLDADLSDWHDPNCPLPRLTLLGPVDVRAHGQLPEVRPRKAWNVEVVAYLACHPRGVSAEQLGTDLWPHDPDIASKSKLRQAIHIARKWLGTNPRTGRDHLPAATPSPGGPALYRVEGLLIDAELFRRLRIRALTRGSHGIADLHDALDLVSGAPFDQRRPGGYAWLAETPLDHEYTGMIVDVAHLVATHHLAAGEPELARAAAQAALDAGSTDDIALLDLVAACDAQGNRAEADRIVQRILANHDAEVEEDLPPRTAQILHRRRWIDRAS